MLKRILTLSLLPLVLVQPIQAVFTYASHLSNGKQNIYFFNDVHDANDKATTQQIHLVSFAKKLNATMLTEEMTDMNPLRPYVHDEKLFAQMKLDGIEHLQKEESKQFPLRGLALFARSAGIDAENIDYRQWVDAFRAGRSVTGRMAMHILDSVIDDIRHYNDHPIFNAYYKECADMVSDVFKPLWDYLRTSDATVAELTRTDEFKNIVSQIQNDPRKKELKYSSYWIAFDSKLFDCILLHELANSKDEQTIVCAGAYHCNKVSELLQQAGFTQSFECGQASGSTNPMNMNAFMNKVLKDRIQVCMEESTRAQLIDKALESVLQENQQILNSPWAYGSLSSMLVIVIICMLAMCGTYAFTRRAYSK